VPRSSAEATNDAASMRIAIGAVRRLTRKPADPNATNSTADDVAAMAPFALTSSARPTTVGR